MRTAERLVLEHNRPIAQILTDALACCANRKEAAAHLGISYSVMTKLVDAHLKPEKHISIVKRLEQQHGKPFRQLLVETLNGHASVKSAADSLGIKNMKYMYMLMQEYGVEKITYFE